MAIITDNPNYEGVEFTWQYQDFSWHREDAVCFFCGKKLTFPYVAWTGSSNALDQKDGNASWLFLHPDCATRLMLRLSRDLHSIEHMLRKPEGDPSARKRPLYSDYAPENEDAADWLAEELFGPGEKAEDRRMVSYVIGNVNCDTPRRRGVKRRHQLWITTYRNFTCGVCGAVIPIREPYIKTWPPKGRGPLPHCRTCCDFTDVAFHEDTNEQEKQGYLQRMKSSQPVAARNQQFKTGDKVRHNLFGEGIVLESEQYEFVEVQFGEGIGKKRLSVNFANLEKL